MTSKTSLFNGGIYKSTVRRYIWGAVFYAIVLFMLTSMIILFDVNPQTSSRTMAEHGALILSEAILYAPILISFFVPTVVALLVYRTVHSKKTSIFVHSLPVSRGENYVSTLLAAFTLMAAPIVLNGIILMGLSLFGYGAFFDIPSCLIWIGFNLLSIFIMFSVATLSAFLTGNSFAMVGINALLHCILLIIMGSLSSIAYIFLYGYYETNLLMNAATRWNFIAYIMGQINRISYNSDVKIPFGWVSLIVIMLIAIGAYVAAYLLYRKRRIEVAEDVAAYKCLNPIYKYLLTAIAALGTFAVAGNALEQGSYIVAFVVPIVSAVVYFGAEMILKKSLRIWKSYKGYLVFLAAFTVFICSFAYTSMFGFETRIPKADEIKKIVVHETRAMIGDKGVEDWEIIDYSLGVHEELIQKENVYTFQTYPSNRTEFLYFNYELENGKTMIRRYPVTEERLCDVMDNLYKSKEYKRKALEMFSEDIGRIYSVALYRSEESRISDEKQVAELVNCLREDLLALEYTQINANKNACWNMNIGVEYARANEKDNEYGERGLYTIHQSINANFRNTVKWLISNGYEKELFNPENYDLTILTADEWNKLNGRPDEETMLEIASGKEMSIATRMRLPTVGDIHNLIRISDPKIKDEIRDFAVSTPSRYEPGKLNSHYVIAITSEGYLTELAGFCDEAEIEKFIS